MQNKLNAKEAAAKGLIAAQERRDRTIAGATGDSKSLQE
jgi:hypothetical protein